MLISEIYEKYKILPNLQLHQLRAAAVGVSIAEKWTNNSDKTFKIDKNAIVSVLLLHDMGNIIKFELERFPHFLGEEQKRLEYWIDVQKLFREKYGSDEHESTFEIAREIGIPEATQLILENMGSSNLAKVTDMQDFNSKICIYSDLRIAPSGVVSVNERFDDLIERYRGRNHGLANIEKTEQNRIYSLQIEKQIQQYCSIDLNTINDKSISAKIDNLKTFNIKTGFT